MHKQSQLHVLLGWHRVQKTSITTLIDKWIQEREETVREIFRSKIMGGKDVFELMKRNGWFTLSAQIQPVKTSKAIIVSDLKHYEPVVLVTKQSSDVDRLGGKDYLHRTSGWYVLGMVDRRLNVREAIFQTPRVTCYISKCYFYYWQDDEKRVAEWKKFLEHIKTVVKHSFPHADNDGSYYSNSHTGNRLTTKSVNLHVPIFTEKKRRMNILSNELYDSRMARLIVRSGPSHFSYEKYLLFDNRANIDYTPCWEVLQVLLAQNPMKVSKKPMFIDYNDNE